jgi:hypothetical protein
MNRPGASLAIAGGATRLQRSTTTGAPQLTRL